MATATELDETELKPVAVSPTANKGLQFGDDACSNTLQTLSGSINHCHRRSQRKAYSG